MLQSWMTVQVAAKTREAAEVYSFELADPGGRDLPAFTAGSHIDVEIAPGVVRQYSLCNHPDERGRYLIAVLREPQSRGGSVALHDQLQPGSSLRISEPRNHFSLEPSATRSRLLAGGIGITPILCMAERLANVGAEFQMHYCARSRSRAAFCDRIATSPFADRVRLHFDDGEAEQQLDLARVLAAPTAGEHLYVCGPAGLIEAALRTAREAGWPDSQVHREFFAAPVTPEAGLQEGAFEVKLASSGKVFAIPAGKPITDVLAEAGIAIEVSCQQGVCGTCRTRVLEGEPDHRDYYLTPEEQARNDQLTPCCSRSKTPLLVLDL